MMEEVILGLLSFSNKTIYELKQIFQKELSLAYSASLGCLEIVLKKLLDKEEISFYELEENGIRKKYYQLESLGVTRFQKWMSEPFKSTQFRDVSLAKIYFLTAINPADQIQLLKDQIAKTKKELNLLIDQTTEDVEESGSWLLEYRTQLLKLNLKWYKKIIKCQKDKLKPL